MNENQSATVQSLLQYALPTNTMLAAGVPEKSITWAVTVRAQPPAFPELYGGELALVSMEMLRSYDSRITLAEVISALAQAGVSAVAVKEEITQSAINVASDAGIALLALPEDSNLARIERAVNELIVNQKAQMMQRALEIQRQLTRQAAENRDLNSLLQIMARATAKPVVVHDDAGVMIAQVYPTVARRPIISTGSGGRSLVQSLPYGAFQNWLAREAPHADGAILPSPLGFTTVLRVEKRTAGYLSLAVSYTHLTLPTTERV